MKKQPHIRNTIEKLITQWNREGFNDVRVKAELEGCWRKGDEPKKAWSERAKRYAIFLFEPQFERIEDDAPYQISYIDEEGFWEDFRQELKNKLGDISIKIYDKCKEVEVERHD